MFKETPGGKLEVVDHRERAEKIIKAVELEVYNQEKPTISISDFGAQELSSLENRLVIKGQEGPSVIAVVRCWDKTEAELTNLLERINKFQKDLPGLKGVFISISNNKVKGDDNSGFTEMNLQKAKDKVPTNIPIVPITIDNYSWTAGLNAPAAMMNEICLEKGIDAESIRVMNISFDVDIPETELKKCNENIQENKYTLTARRTSDNANPFINDDNGQKLWEKFRQIMRQPRKADLVELAYTMRNTLNFIPLSDIVQYGGFNPLCNGEARKFFTPKGNHYYRHMDDNSDNQVVIKGMEDIEFFMRLVLSTLNSGKTEMIKNLRRSMDNPVFYNDSSWNDKHEGDKGRKIGDEMLALSLILDGMATKEIIPTNKPGESRTVGLTRDLRVPKAMQDFYFRR